MSMVRLSGFGKPPESRYRQLNMPQLNGCTWNGDSTYIEGGYFGIQASRARVDAPDVGAGLRIGQR